MAPGTIVIECRNNIDKTASHQGIAQGVDVIHTLAGLKVTLITPTVVGPNTRPMILMIKSNKAAAAARIAGGASV